MSEARVDQETASSTSPTTTGTGGKAQARLLFLSGRTAWDEQRYEDACTLFQESQSLNESAAALLNLGRCHEMNNDVDSARKSYRGALTWAEKETDETKSNLWRSAAFEALERLGPEETDESVEEPVITPIVAPPKEEPQPAPQAAAEKPPRRSFFRKPATPWIFMAGGAGLVLGSVATGIVSLNANSKLDKECDENRSCRPTLDATKRRAKTAAIATDVLWLSGAIFAGTGLVLRLTRSENGQPSVGVSCGSFGCGGSLSGSF